MVDILNSQVWSSFGGLDSAQDFLGCREMVCGLDVSIYWLLHLSGAYPFHFYLLTIERVDTMILVEYLRTHILSLDMRGLSAPTSCYFCSMSLQASRLTTKIL